MKELCVLTEVYLGACPATFLLYKPDLLAKGYTVHNSLDPYISIPQTCIPVHLTGENSLYEVPSSPVTIGCVKWSVEANTDEGSWS